MGRNMTHILEFINEFPYALGIILLFALFLGQTLLVTFPIYVIMLIAGLMYGPWLGSLINLFGMMSTIMFGYLLGSIGKMDDIMEHPSMERFKLWVEKNGILAVAILRVVPFIPYNVTSIGSGVLHIDLRKYSIYNFLGMIPVSILWAVLGDYFGEVILEALHFEFDISVLIPSVIFFVLLIGGYFYLKRRLKKPTEEVEVPHLVDAPVSPVEREIENPSDPSNSASEE